MIQSVKSRRVSNFFRVIRTSEVRAGGFLDRSEHQTVSPPSGPLAFLRFTTNCLLGRWRDGRLTSRGRAEIARHTSRADAPGSPDTPCSISLTSANVVKSTATAANDRGHYGKRSNLLGEPRRCRNLRSAYRAPQCHAGHTVRNRFFARASAPLVPTRRHRAQQGTAQLQVVGALRRLGTQGKRWRLRSRERGKRALGQADPTALDQAPCVVLRHDRRLGGCEPRARARVYRLTARHPRARRSSGRSG